MRCVELKWGVEFERHFGERAPKGTSLERDLENSFGVERFFFFFFLWRVGGGGAGKVLRDFLVGERESEVEKKMFGAKN